MQRRKNEKTSLLLLTSFLVSSSMIFIRSVHCRMRPGLELEQSEPGSEKCNRLRKLSGSITNLSCVALADLRLQEDLQNRIELEYK